LTSLTLAYISGLPSSSSIMSGKAAPAASGKAPVQPAQPAAPAPVQGKPATAPVAPAPVQK
jgi:hypothetical protein